MLTVVHGNVNKSAVMVFARDAVEVSWRWGENVLPNVSTIIWALTFNVMRQLEAMPCRDIGIKLS